VVDDGSTDNGPAIVQSINDPRIKLILQVNSGAAAARNRGIKEASFDLISFLDADDEWKPHYLEIIRGMIRRFPEAGMYSTAYEVVNEKGKKYFPKYRSIPDFPWEGIIPSYFRSATSAWGPVWTSCVTLPKYVFDQCGDFPVSFIRGQDRDMWDRVALRFPVAFSTMISATYYLNASNRYLNKKYQAVAPHPFLLKAQHLIEKGDIPKQIPQADLEDFIAYNFIFISRTKLVHLKEPSEARRILLNVRPQTINTAISKYLLILISFLPQQFIKYIYELKQVYKAIMKRP
jgi:glycosyltransferase involved in cell wall biosynthesis